MLIVKKFGGSSVRDAARLQNVARIVTDAYRQGNEVVVVVSAQGDTTDDLIAKAREINKKASQAGNGHADGGGRADLDRPARHGDREPKAAPPSRCSAGRRDLSPIPPTAPPASSG